MALICSAVGAVSAQESAAPEPAEKTGYTRDMETLQGLGFFDLDASSPEAAITRGEAASVLANVLDPERQRLGTQTGFVDVLPEFWASEAVWRVTQSGWMGRSENGYFYPSAPLTETELLSVLIHMTGYAAEAEANGGYPQGYFYAARLAGMKQLGVSSQPVSYQTFCSRLLEALNTKLMLTEYGKPDSRYISDQTYMEQNLKLYRATGRVTATETLHFYGDSAVKENHILIDSTDYGVRDGTDTASYFGYQVEFYYTERSGEQTVLYLRRIDGKNQTLTIELENMISVHPDRIEYYQGNHVRTVSLSNQADVLCNGEAVAALPDIMTYDHAVVRLIASAGGAYDYINIMAYETYVVQSYQKDAFQLYGKYNTDPLLLDAQNTDLLFSDTMGNPLELSILKEGDVLSVARSSDGEHLTILYSTLSVSGRLDTITEDKISVHGTDYELCRSAKARAGELSAGSEYYFYLDGFGRVADWKTGTDTNRVFAYLTKIAGDRLEGTSVRLFDSNGKFDTKKLADKVMIDGVRIRTDTDAEPVKQALLKDGVYDQLIVYSTNGAGEISYIDTSKKGAEESENTLTNIFNNFADRTGSSSTRLKYSTATRIFSGKVIIDENVKVFFVPADAATADESFFEVKTISRYQQDKQYSLDCYKVNQDSFTSAVNVEYISTKRELDSTSPGLFLVNEIAQTINPEDEIVMQLNGFGPKGAAVSVTLDSDVNLNAVKHAGSDERTAVAVGDVVRYKTNPAGDAIHLELYFDESERKLLTANNPSTGTATGIAYSDQHRFIWGNVYNKLGNIAMVVRDDLPLLDDDIANAGWWEYQVLDKSAIFLFDQTGKSSQFRRITKDEVLDYVHVGEAYAQVLAYTYWGDANTIVVYERREAGQ